MYGQNEKVTLGLRFADKYYIRVCLELEILFQKLRLVYVCIEYVVCSYYISISVIWRDFVGWITQLKIYLCRLSWYRVL